MLWKLIRQTVRILRTRIRRIITNKLYLRKVTIPRYSIGSRKLLFLRYYFKRIFSFSLNPKYFKNIIKLQGEVTQGLHRPKTIPNDIRQNIIVVQDYRIDPFPRQDRCIRTSVYGFPLQRIPLSTRWFHINYRTYYSWFDIVYPRIPFNTYKRQE